jgi:hypothetical protein
MACGLMMLPRITSASLRGSGEFVLPTRLAVMGLEGNYQQVARNVDTKVPSPLKIRVSLKGLLPSLTDFIPRPSS